MSTYTEEVARGIILGYNPVATLDEYYDAWQALYDLNVTLCDADLYYMGKLIDDGYVLTPENYEELGGVPVRGYSSRHAYLSAEEV